MKRTFSGTMYSVTGIALDACFTIENYLGDADTDGRFLMSIKINGDQFSGRLSEREAQTEKTEQVERN